MCRFFVPHLVAFSLSPPLSLAALTLSRCVCRPLFAVDCRPFGRHQFVVSVSAVVVLGRGRRFLFSAPLLPLVGRGFVRMQTTIVCAPRTRGWCRVSLGFRADGTGSGLRTAVTSPGTRSLSSAGRAEEGGHLTHFCRLNTPNKIRMPVLSPRGGGAAFSAALASFYSSSSFAVLLNA